MSVHAETARDRRDGWTDRQMAFHLYIVDVDIYIHTYIYIYIYIYFYSVKVCVCVHPRGHKKLVV